MRVDRIIKKVLKLPKLLKSYFSTDGSVLLALIENEAKEILRYYNTAGTCNTEGIEDLLFHIKSYYEIPEIIRQTEFDFVEDRGLLSYEDGLIGIPKEGSKQPTIEELEVYVKYVEEVEKQRAVERDFIFEKLKELPLELSSC